ncbi:hypothetical protein CPC16_010745 [Podila verticillata]|nr:hypothetical protein CPC16_010745 [Podila verticillata]
MAKDGIGYLARVTVDVSTVKLFGVVAAGKCNDSCVTVYTTELVTKGVYIMKAYAVFYVPRSKDDLAVTGTAMDVLMNMKIELEVLISQCEGLCLSCPIDRTTTSY